MSFGHRASAPPRHEPLVTSLLWSLTKSGHRAEARVRTVDGVGVELRYEWNGELRESRVFRTREELAAAAGEKQKALREKGWLDQSHG